MHKRLHFEEEIEKRPTESEHFVPQKLHNIVQYYFLCIRSVELCQKKFISLRCDIFSDIYFLY